MVASGSTAESIAVAHFPCFKRGGFVQGAGHASAVSQLSWLAGDGVVMSAGSKDRTLLQWKCVYDQTRDSGREGGHSCEDSEIEFDGGHQQLNLLAVEPTPPSLPALSSLLPSTVDAASAPLQLKWMPMVSPPSLLSPPSSQLTRQQTPTTPIVEIDLDVRSDETIVVVFLLLLGVHSSVGSFCSVLTMCCLCVCMYFFCLCIILRLLLAVVVAVCY